MNELIRIEDVVKRYGNALALDGVNLEVHRGEFLAVLGPSGCGKTTLLRLIAGFVEPSGGAVWIDGKSMANVPPNRRPVNTVFQSYALFPHYTVEENVAFGPRRSRIDKRTTRKLVGEALATVRMQEFATRYPAQLSGGQQQRVALARAIVNKPKVLLLDEPLSALDLKLRKNMQLELRHIHKMLGMTFIYVTHDQEEALVMADRIVVMNAGKIVQIGSGIEIYQEPNSTYVADFIGEANLIPGTVDTSGKVTVEGDNSAPHAANGAAAVNRVIVMVRPEDIQVGAMPGEGDFVSLEVVIRQRVFIGNSVRIYASTGPGLQLSIRVSDRDAVKSVQENGVVRVFWARKAMRVVERLSITDAPSPS